MTKESKRKEKYTYKLSQTYHQTVGVVWWCMVVHGGVTRASLTSRMKSAIGIL
jgi:hypothetical protein